MRDVSHAIWSFGVKAAALSGTLLALYAMPYRVVMVEGSSMWPTYDDHSLHLMRTKAEPLYHGEVVVAKSPIGVVIKRIAYLPGDEMEQMRIAGRWVTVGNYRPRHPYAKLCVLRWTHLPAGEVYLIGDNLWNSTDSRSFGPLPIANVLGSLEDQRPQAGATSIPIMPTASA